MSLNALHSFFLKISRPATIAVITAVTLLFFWLINFRGVPDIPAINSLLRIGLPDMMFTYSPSSIYEKLTQFGADGRSPMASSLNASISCSPRCTDFSLLWSPPSAFHVCSPAAQLCKNSACFPCSSTLFDYAENLCFLAILRSYPAELPNFEKLANTFTLAKWTFAAVSIVLLLVATLGLLIRNLRRPASP